MRIAFLQFGAMADVLFATPILRHVREIHPNALITWFIRDKFADVIENNPHLNSIRKYSLVDLPCRQDAEHIMWRQMKEDAAKEFDLVIKPQQWPDHDFYRSNASLLDLMIENAGFDPNKIINRNIVLGFNENDINNANTFERSNSINWTNTITCNHISYASSPCLSFEQYQFLTNLLNQNGLNVIFTGALNEPIPMGRNVIDARGISFKEWAILINRSGLHLSLDSGAKTLAAAGDSFMIVLHNSKDFSLHKTGCKAMGIRKHNILELLQPFPTTQSLCSIIINYKNEANRNL